MPHLQTIQLSGISETTLWTLHNRASEAARPDGVLRDPDAVRVYRSIDYDFIGKFGAPDGSHAVRSLIVDQWVREWMEDNPGCNVVELACGLETQYQRCDDGRVQWKCIDLPQAMEARRQFLPPSDRCTYLEQSAFDISWFDDLDHKRPVFVSAQGLLMYFAEAEVRRLISAIYDQLSDVIFVFDTVPPWFSRKSMKGFAKTANYVLPPLPWGISHGDLEPTLKSWNSKILDFQIIQYMPARGALRLASKVLLKIPGIINFAPLVVRAASIG